MTEINRSVEIVDFVPSYIFNSSKCFAAFPPAGLKIGSVGALAASAPA
jgi:hypothetical protein